MDSSISLFLDLDGTLVDLIDRPDDVVADQDLRAILMAVQMRLDGRLAIVSGRSLGQLDQILGPVAGHLVLAGSHGAEYRRGAEVEAPARPAALDRALIDIAAFAFGREGVLLEKKSFGVGLHYRLNPAMEGEIQDFARHVAERHGLFLQLGHDMVELRPGGADKGLAIRHLMASQPLCRGRPVFLGDDLTDEAGFIAAKDLGGHGVLVGEQRPTAALYGLSGPRMVRNWLKEMSI